MENFVLQKQFECWLPAAIFWLDVTFCYPCPQARWCQVLCSAHFSDWIGHILQRVGPYARLQHCRKWKKTSGETVLSEVCSIHNPNTSTYCILMEISISDFLAIFTMHGCTYNTNLVSTIGAPPKQGIWLIWRVARRHWFTSGLHPILLFREDWFSTQPWVLGL